MIKAVLGQSENIDTRTAVESVIIQCQQKLSGRQPQAGDYQKENEECLHCTDVPSLLVYHD